MIGYVQPHISKFESQHTGRKERPNPKGMLTALESAARRLDPDGPTVAQLDILGSEVKKAIAKKDEKMIDAAIAALGKFGEYLQQQIASGGQVGSDDGLHAGDPASARYAMSPPDDLFRRKLTPPEREQFGRIVEEKARQYYGEPRRPATPTDEERKATSTKIRDAINAGLATEDEIRQQYSRNRGARRAARPAGAVMDAELQKVVADKIKHERACGRIVEGDQPAELRRFSRSPAPAVNVTRRGGMPYRPWSPERRKAPWKRRRPSWVTWNAPTPSRPKA
jgi:hypothetical protein